MVAAHWNIYERVPGDLRRWLETHNQEPLDFSRTAREPFRDLQKDYFVVGFFRVTVYFGACRKDNVVIVHWPGGLPNSPHHLNAVKS